MPPPPPSHGLGVPETTDLEVLWKHFQGKCDFFGAVKIDDQAGFDELEGLWSRSRVLSGALSLVFVFYNGYYLLTFNFGILFDYWLSNDPLETPSIFLVSDTALRAIFGDGPDAIPAVAVLAMMELTLVLVMYVWATLSFLAMFSPIATECSRFHSVANVFFTVIPTLGTMSMVRMLNYVTPAVLAPALSFAIQRLQFATTGSCELVFFIGTRLLCLFVGFDAFLYKFQLIGHAITKSRQNDFLDLGDLLLTALIFVNQMLGVVQLSAFTKDRLFIFIFAGEDGKMTEEEDATRKTFEAQLCFELMNTHGIWKAMMIYLTFSDADFQKMVLDTKEEAEVELVEAAEQ